MPIYHVKFYCPIDCCASLLIGPCRRGGRSREIGGEMDHAGGRQGDRPRAEMARRAAARRRLVRLGAGPGQRGGLRPGGHGVHVGRQHARPGTVRRPGQSLRRLSAGFGPAQRVHQRSRHRHARPDVRPRLRHDVLGRMLRHVAAAGTARQARKGRQADRQLPEQGRRLALLSHQSTTPIFR